MARRGPEHAAFTRPGALALTRVPGVDVVVDDVLATAVDALADSAAASALREAPRVAIDWTAPPPPGRRVALTVGRTPVGIMAGPDGRVASVELQDAATVAAQLVVAAIGYRGTELPGVPFDATTSTVRNDGGRVVDDAGAPVPGQYVVGWARRGTAGGIGDNRADAEEVVRALLIDAAAVRGKAPRRTPRRLLPLPRHPLGSPSRDVRTAGRSGDGRKPARDGKRARDHRTATRSTTNTRAAPGLMMPPAPRSP